MSDTARIIAMVVMLIIALFVGSPPLIKYLSRLFNITSQDAFSIIILVVNVLAIVIMVITIFANNKSSLDQIRAIKTTTMEEIDAIKTATQNHINKIEEFNKKSKNALISALILEYRENFRIIREILSHEKEYIDETKEGKVALNKFSFEAYQSNLNNATIGDSILLDKIVQVYSGLKLWQSFLDSAMLPNLIRSSSAGFLKNAINQMKENINIIASLEQEITSYKKVHYE